MQSKSLKMESLHDANFNLIEGMTTSSASRDDIMTTLG